MKAYIDKYGQLNIECEKGTSDQFALRHWFERWSNGTSTLHGDNKLLTNPNAKKEN